MSGVKGHGQIYIYNTILLASYVREINDVTRYNWQVMKGRLMLQQDTFGRLWKGDK